MVPCKGRFSFKQYMKSKPTNWDIEVFVLSDTTNAYIYRLQIYAGKNLKSTIVAGLCSRVLLQLMTGQTDINYILTIIIKALQCT